MALNLDLGTCVGMLLSDCHCIIIIVMKTTSKSCVPVSSPSIVLKKFSSSLLRGPPDYRPILQLAGLPSASAWHRLAEETRYKIEHVTLLQK